MYTVFIFFTLNSHLIAARRQPDSLVKQFLIHELLPDESVYFYGGRLTESPLRLL